MKEIDFLRDAAQLSGRQLQMYCERKSDKRLQQTHAEFFTEIDHTILEVGLTIEGVARKINTFLYGQYFFGRETTVPTLKKDLDAFLAPIYIALREKGYNRADLLG